MGLFFANASSSFRVTILRLIVRPYTSLLLRKLRVEYEQNARLEHFKRIKDASRPIVFSFHHGQLIPLVLYAIHAKREGELDDSIGDLHVLTSDAEGAVAGKLLERVGIDYITRKYTVEGIRNAQAKCLEVLNSGGNLALSAEDRYRGSLRKGAVKTGAAKFAADTGSVLVPVAATVASSKVRLWWHWDRLIIPNPFSRCRLVIRFGEPVSTNDTKVDRHQVARKLQKELDKATEKSEAIASESSLHKRTSRMKLLFIIMFLVGLCVAAGMPLSPIGFIGMIMSFIFASALIVITRGYFSRVVLDPSATILEVTKREQTLRQYGELILKAREEILIRHQLINPHFFLESPIFMGMERAIHMEIKVDVLIYVRRNIKDATTLFNYYIENKLLDICFDDGTTRLMKLEEWIREKRLRIRWTKKRIRPPHVIIDKLHIGIDVPQDAGTPFSPRRADFLEDSRVISFKLREKYLPIFRKAKEIKKIRDK